MAGQQKLRPGAGIRNNYAISLYRQEQRSLAACLEVDDEDDCNATTEGELERQAEARDLLEDAIEASPVQQHNLALLDIQRGYLADGMNRFLAVNAAIAADTDFTPFNTHLKQSVLQYIDNHQVSMDFLEEVSLQAGSGMPGFADEAVGIAGQLAGIGSFLPLALFNLISIASIEEQQKAIIDFLNEEMTGYYAADLDFIPVVRFPDLVGTSPY